MNIRDYILEHFLDKDYLPKRYQAPKVKTSIKKKIVIDPETGESKELWAHGKVHLSKHLSQYKYKSPATIVKAGIKGRLTKTIRKALGLYNKDSSGKTGVKDFVTTRKYLKAQGKLIKKQNKKRLSNGDN